jgi:hypothetical protein
MEYFPEMKGKPKTYRLKDESLYEGPVENGVIRGFGSLYLNNGGVYMGFFENNIP